MKGSDPLVWALLGSRDGDNNQVLALVEELGFPFETKQLRYRRVAGQDLGKLRPRHLGRSLISLDKQSQEMIRPPWPDLVIGIGRRSVPAARYIRKMSGNQAKLVRIGNPRCDPLLFDLVITTPQYLVPPAPNVLQLPVAMSRFRGPAKLDESDRAWLGGHPRPHLLLALGGNTKDVKLDQAEIEMAAARLAARGADRGGTLLIVGSRRTDQNFLTEAARYGALVNSNGPSFAALLDDADEIFVTADSVSMLSEAIATGKPIGMIPVAMTHAGLRGVGEASKGLFDFRSPRRDPRRFWARLLEAGAVGTVDAPRASTTENPVKVAAEAVRQLLGYARHDVATSVTINEL